MDQKKNYITPDGMEKLKREYHELVSVERPRVVETVAWAASNGDRSENADYLYGKKRLREIDRRLRFLNERMDAAQVVDPSLVQSDAVLFGATVTISSEDGAETAYQIVGEDEFDVNQGKISWRSPLAQGLLGKKVGDEAVVRKPSGEQTVVIEKIQYILINKSS